jgi:hypothetical protein
VVLGDVPVGPGTELSPGGWLLLGRKNVVLLKEGGSGRFVVSETPGFYELRAVGRAFLYEVRMLDEVADLVEVVLLWLLLGPLLGVALVVELVDGRALLFFFLPLRPLLGLLR